MGILALVTKDGGGGSRELTTAGEDTKLFTARSTSRQWSQKIYLQDQKINCC
jgi:hypothetical protein